MALVNKVRLEELLKKLEDGGVTGIKEISIITTLFIEDAHVDYKSDTGWQNVYSLLVGIVLEEPYSIPILASVYEVLDPIKSRFNADSLVWFFSIKQEDEL